MINSLLFIDNKCLGDTMLLVDVVPNMYVKNQRLDSPNGYKYSVTVRAHKSDKLVVTIPGPQIMEIPSTMQDVYVAFENLQVRPYVDKGGHLLVAASATGIKTVKRPDDILNAHSTNGANTTGNSKT